MLLRAEQEFQHAIAIARSQRARLFELQACSGLAQLMLLQGRAAQARDLLQPVHGWFSEGLGLPHLRGASEMLARCNA